MMPISPTTTFYPTTYEGNKIEHVISNANFRDNFWRNVAPINSVSKANKINFKLIKEFVVEFFNQLTQKKEYFQHISIDNLLSHFIQGASGLLLFAPNKISVELTSATSIFIVATKENTNIYLEIFFDETTGKFSEAVVNVYENKTQQLAVNGSIPKVINEIEAYYKLVSINYFSYLEKSYAIPGNTTPSNAF